METGTWGRIWRKCCLHETPTEPETVDLLCDGIHFIPEEPKVSLRFVCPSICYCYIQHSVLLLGWKIYLKKLRWIVLAFMPIYSADPTPFKKHELTVYFRKTRFLVKTDFRKVCKTQATEASRRSFCVTTAPDWDHGTENCICQWAVSVPKIVFWISPFYNLLSELGVEFMMGPGWRDHWRHFLCRTESSDNNHSCSWSSECSFAACSIALKRK